MEKKSSTAARRQKKLFETARRNLQRALPKAVREVAKKTDWRTAQGVLFRDAGGWFVEVAAIPWVIEARTPARLYSKPMSLDPLFWKIVGLDENINQPLSFRAFGAFTCRTPTLREADIPEEGGQAEAARRLLHWADEQLDALRDTQSVDGFIEFIRTHPDQVERQSHLPALVTGLLLLGRDKEALDICTGARTRGGFGGGFLFMGSSGTKSFLDLAVEWITNTGRSRAIN